MDFINWNEVKDTAERPEAGGYVAVITAVEDDVAKKCLFISWDFIDGPFKGANADTASAVGFWPMKIARSYKPKALGFFKAFKTAVEESNRGFIFQNDPQSLVGKFIGVVLGEEAYRNKKGDVRNRTYVHQVRSAHAIKTGDFSVPPFKPIADTASTTSYAPIEEDDSGLPW